jgi:hypothetical protein
LSKCLIGCVAFKKAVIIFKVKYKNMKKALLYCSALLILGTSCKKNDDNNSNPNSSSRKTQLTTGKWKITASISTFDLGNGMTQNADLFSLLSPCQQDNLYIFNADNTATADEGATKCNSSDPQSKAAGNWQLLNNDTQLSLQDPTNPLLQSITADIVQLDNTTLVVKYNTALNGVQAATTTTYAHVN